MAQIIYSNPTEPNVLSGKADIKSLKNLLQVKALDRTIVEWGGFSISLDEIAEFALPDSSSVIVNRVVGSSMSEIFGELKSNGQIYLINPHGVLIGPTGTIDASSFLASTLDILDEDFLAGQKLLFQGSSEAPIVNLGRIRCADGEIILLAAQIDNQGDLSAPGGFVGLASGGKILLQPNRHERIYIQSDAASISSIDHSGSIECLAAEVKSYGAFTSAIRLSGKIDAFDIKEQGGRVFILAEEGTTSLSGQISCPGGEAAILGKEVHIMETALIDVSSSGRSGNILAGGSFQGKDASIYNSSLTRVDSGAKLIASGREGGRVVVWSDGLTYFKGDISVAGERGGFAEVSGKGRLYYDGFTDLRGDVPGALLLDPQFLTITAGGLDPFVGNHLFTDNVGGTSTVSGTNVSAPLDAGDVFLQATTDLIIDDMITQTMGTGNLFLQTGRSIAFSALGNITMAGNDVSATINDSAVTMNRTAGDASFSMAAGSSIDTAGGNVDITRGDFGGLFEGFVTITGGSINAAGGNISITGTNYSGAATSAHGIFLTTVGTLSTTGMGTISLTGTGGDQTGGLSHGISIDVAGTSVSSVDGNITFTGLGGNLSDANFGVSIGTSAVVSTSGLGSVSMNGTGGAGANSNYGIRIGNSATVSTSSSGGISLTGSSNGTASNNVGVILEDFGNVTTMDGSIDITGTGGGKADLAPPGSSGVRLSGTSIVFSDNGPIQITGTGTSSTGSFSSGVEIGGTVTTITSPITIQGTGANGVASNTGVVLSGSITSTTPDQLVSVTGFGGPNATGDFNGGVVAITGTISNGAGGPNSASILVSGTGGGGTDNCVGILTLNTNVTGNVAAITFIGTGGNATGTQNAGLLSSTGSDFSTNFGSISITAAGGSGSGQNVGLALSDAGTTISTADEPLQINAAAGANTANAILITNGPLVNTNAAGLLSISTSLGDCSLVNQANIDSDSGSILLNIHGNLTLTAGPMATDNPAIRITNAVASSPILLLAGENITLASVAGGGVAEISNAGTGNLTLVCDNLFPTAPNVGTGGFNISSIISSLGELRIYTSSPLFNTINDLINGQPFIPGIFGLDTATEIWNTYYPGGAYGGGAFTFYYKVGELVQAAIATLNKLLIAEAQLSDMLPLPYIHYYLQFCYQDYEDKEKICNPDLDAIYIRKPFYKN